MYDRHCDMRLAKPTILIYNDMVDPTIILIFLLPFYKYINSANNFFFFENIRANNFTHGRYLPNHLNICLRLIFYRSYKKPKY